MMRFTWTSIFHADQAGSLSFVVLVNASFTSAPHPRYYVLGRSEYASESGPGGPPCSLWRTKKRYGFGPGGGYKKREV